MQLFRHHHPRYYPTVAGQLGRLKWMLKQCRIRKLDHLAKLIEQQIKALGNGL